MSNNQWPTAPVPSSGGPATSSGFGPTGGAHPGNSYPAGGSAPIGGGSSAVGGPGAHQPGAQPPGGGPRRRGGALKVVLALLGVLVLLAFIAGGLYLTRRLPGVSPATGPTATGPTATTTPAALRFADHAAVEECAKDERTPFLPTFNVGLRVTNKGKDTASYVVITELVDSAGMRLEEFNDKVTRLAPGQSTRVRHSLLREVPTGARCNVLKVERTPE